MPVPRSTAAQIFVGIKYDTQMINIDCTGTGRGAGFAS